MLANLRWPILSSQHHEKLSKRFHRIVGASIEASRSVGGTAEGSSAVKHHNTKLALAAERKVPRRHRRSDGPAQHIELWHASSLWLAAVGVFA